jgi:hypothetical protein
MSTKFTDFILQLGSNPGAAEQLKKNPALAMTEAGLSSAEQTILLNGDPNLIRQTIAKELGIDSALLVPFFTITITLTTVHVNVHVSE